MTRFDLIFPIKDLPDVEKDKKTASHMLNLHQSPMGFETPLSTDFLKKYICYARQKIHPQLTDSATDEIKDYYITMRNSSSTEGGVSVVPISPRQLEALIRLSEASAKLRMGDKVTKKDAKNAIDILDYCLRNIGLDPDTGKIDIDRISSGITASQRGKIHIIKEIIDTIEKAKGDKVIAVEEIIKAAQEKNVEDTAVYEILDKLRISGDIFEPKRGFISKL
jgi:replicative DNA helicase Mcm